MNSGSFRLIIYKRLADTLAMKDNKSSKDIINTIVVFVKNVKCNDWTAEDSKDTVVEDGQRPIIGRDLFPQLDLSLDQSNFVLSVNQSQCPIKSQIAFGVPNLISKSCLTNTQ